MQHLHSTIGIIGAGTMGAGIAYAASFAGMRVCLHDMSRRALSDAKRRMKADFEAAVQRGFLTKKEGNACLSGIRFSTSLKSFRSCDLVIEAIIEDLSIKKQLFSQLDLVCKENAILATNTSSLSVTSIASSTKHPERVLGLHFFNPVARMKLVEVIRGVHTSEPTLASAIRFIEAIRKVAIVVRDTPGFVVNRVARPFYGEALRLLGEGVATAEEIDKIVRLEGNFKMGPFELMDLIGIDVNLAVTTSIYEQTSHEPRYRPHRIQKRMVESGTLGKKSGKGFYSYE